MQLGLIDEPNQYQNSLGDQPTTIGRGSHDYWKGVTV